MKADWNDAPQHLKRKRQSAGRWVFAITIGAAMATYVADQKLPFPPAPLIAQANPTERYAPKYKFNEPTGHSTTTPEQLLGTNVNERNRHQAQSKQTIYKDTNFLPKDATNVIGMRAVRQSEANPNPVVASSRSSRNSVELKSYIDVTQVCASHKCGSIDYREYRKVATQFFKGECLYWEAEGRATGIKIAT